MVGEDDAIAAQIPTECLTGPVDKVTRSPWELAAVAAQQSLSGINPPPVELRRGKLACDDPLRQVRLPLQTAIISVALLMLILAGSFLFRAHRYDELSRSAESQQLESFKSALPNQMPPPLITSRLISEEKRLEGLRGVSGALPPVMTALPVIRDVLRGLAIDLRFRITELRFEPGRFYLEGQTLDHTAADQIAASLHENSGLPVDEPHTQQPPGEDVTFEISSSAPAGDGPGGSP
jgi:hypothetical protein